MVLVMNISVVTISVTGEAVIVVVMETSVEASVVDVHASIDCQFSPTSHNSS